MAIVSNHIYISALVSCTQSAHPWGSEVWTLEQVESSQQGNDRLDMADNVVVWPDLKLQIYANHCESYYHNLMSNTPKIYLVCLRQESGELKPHFITVDYDEANAYIETGEEVLIATLPDTLCQWLERFVIEHYQPEEPKKRRRKQWHDEKPS